MEGVTAPMISVTIVRTVSFSLYQRSKYLYCGWLNKLFKIDVLGHVNTKGSYPNFSSASTFFAAGMTAGSIISVLACEFGPTVHKGDLSSGVIY